MKPLLTIIFVFYTTISLIGQNSDKNFDNLINKCSDINSGNFKCKPYINLAIYVQSIEKTDAVLLLKEFSTSQQYEDEMIILTRMLFQSTTKKPLRRPYIGGASFFGNTDYKDWQNEPIEIVNGIPFLITRGYSLGGYPESSLDYLLYCISNGEWNSIIYSIKTEEEMKSSLNLLLISEKWHSKISSFDKVFFENQIQ